MTTAMQPGAVSMGANAEAGPSKVVPKRKPSAPHPSTAAHNARVKRRKLPPPLPVSASNMREFGPGAGGRPGHARTLPLQPMQGAGTKRTDTGRRSGGAAMGMGREVVLITRKMGVGAYLGRCKSLICDEGYTHIVLHAIGAAIPQALVILHALLDVLPYPRHPRGAWYELFTGSVACMDEEESAGNDSTGKEADAAGGDKVKSWLRNIGSVEASETVLKERIASSLQIHIHIGPKAEIALDSATNRAKQEKAADSKNADTTGTADPGKGKKRARPGKQKRRALTMQKMAESGQAGEGMEVDEEAAMNGNAASEDEEVEMIEA